jgi:hypothetical protein
MVKADSKPVSEKELEEESDIEEIIEKDSQGVPQLLGQDNVPDETNYDEETYVGKPAPKESETYIQERKSYSMMHTDQNKLKNTKIGDHINYYDNGVAGAGVVTKMSGQIIQIFKDDGQYHNLSINDTFHVADILINKTWNAMNMEERTTELIKIKAYSPRFLGKTWEQLPRELKDVMKIQPKRGVGSFGGSDLPQGDKTPATVTGDTKFFDQNGKQHATKEEADAIGQKTGRNLRTERAARDSYNADKRQTIGQRTNVTQSKISKAEWDAMKSSIEDGALGNTGSSPTTGVSTKIPFDAAPDYEGASHAKISPDTAFDYEDVKPEAGKEPQAPKVDKDEQGIVKTQEFTYSDKPNNYKVPQDKYKGTSRYGIRYGVKFINKEGDE